MNKTMVKLVWSLVALVLIVGIVRLAIVSNSDQSDNHKILNMQSK